VKAASYNRGGGEENAMQHLGWLPSSIEETAVEARPAAKLGIEENEKLG